MDYEVKRVKVKQDKEEETKEFRIDYSFNGYGHTYIEAVNEEEARDKFSDGEFETDNESDGYNIDEIYETQQ